MVTLFDFSVHDQLVHIQLPLEGLGNSFDQNPLIIAQHYDRYFSREFQALLAYYVLLLLHEFGYQLLALSLRFWADEAQLRHEGERLFAL